MDPLTWPRPEASIDWKRWLWSLKALQKTGFQVLHEFPKIEECGISTPIANISALQDDFADYLTRSSFYVQEFIAYKIWTHIDVWRLLGPFPTTYTHFKVFRQGEVNNNGVVIPIQRTPIFVVMRENLEKWREVLDFGRQVANGLSINDYIVPEFVSIKLSRLHDMIAIFLGCTHASNLDWQTAFKQIRIYHMQWPYFAFDFNGATYISSVFEFGRRDAPIEFSKCSKTLVLIAIMSHPELFTKKCDIFKGTVSRFPRILDKPDNWLDSKGVNLTRLINRDRVHLMDVMMDD